METAVLEQALRDDPDDLAAWHAYGEDLLAQGDPRGALIHLEERRAHAGPSDGRALAGEIAALEEEHGAAWDAGLPPGVTVLARRYGFVTKVAVEWTEDAPALIEQALQERFVTALRISPVSRDDEDEDDYDDDEEEEEYEEEYDEEDDEDGYDYDRESEWRVPVLRPVDVGAFARLDLGRLTELDLSYLCIGESGASLLASAVGDRLAALDLRYCGIGDGGLAAFAATAGFQGLRRLHLQRNRITAQGVPLLGLFEHLTDLDLRYNRIGEEGAKALAEAPFAASLKRLLLYRPDITRKGADVLASADRLPPLLRSYWRCV